MSLPVYENAISRQAVEEMIKAEMPERGMWEIEGDKEKETVCEVCVDLMQKLSELPSVKPVAETATTADCISRKDALKPFCITPDGTRIPEVDCDNFPVEFSVKDIKRHLLSLPPIEPKRPKGEWIENAPEWQDIDPPYICSICGHAESTRTPFCEQCGADMRGEEE